MRSSNSFPKDWLSTQSPILSIRTFHYTLNTPNWISFAVQNNIQVMVGITLNDYENELNKFSSDYLNASQTLKSQYDLYVIAIGIGNEQPISEITNMINGMNKAKMMINNNLLPKNAKVTTALELSGDWIIGTFPPSDATFTSNFLQLAPILDIICFNVYAYFTPTNIPLEIRLSWTSNTPSVTLNIFGAIRFAMIKADILDKPFWCTETGWESQNQALDGNIMNLETFYKNFLNFDMDEQFLPQDSNISVSPPDRIFYFTIRDTNNQTFGLYLNSLIPKF